MVETVVQGGDPDREPRAPLRSRPVGGIYARLEEAGHVLTHYEETVRVGRATAGEAAALRTTPGTPLLRLVRRAHTATRVVEVNLITMLGERFELHYEAPAE